MLQVKLICVGKLKERFFLDAFEEYRKRLGAYCRLDCAEIPEQRLPEDPSDGQIRSALEKEGAEILRAVPPDAYMVALCVEGRQLPSEAMAELIAGRENSGKPKLCFVIGGSFGLSDTVKARSELRLSMSKMTFPHHLVRVMLLEQLYRAFQIQMGSKYHK